MSLAGFLMLTIGPLVQPAVAPPLRAANWRDFPCPACGADVDESCSSPNGHRGRPHRERTLLAGGAP